MTTTRNLKEPVYEGGIKTPYFFNGRLLTADALRDGQTANHLYHRQIGRVMGEGVAEGMIVSISNAPGQTASSTVEITPGAALNRAGQVLELQDTVHLKLTRDTTETTDNSGDFAPCDEVQPDQIPSGTGVYILVAYPASGFEGKAPMHGLEDDGKLSGCNYKYEKEGIQFRLVFLDIENPSFSDDILAANIIDLMSLESIAGRSKLRNLLAHFCLGTGTAMDFPTDLYGTPGSAALQEYGPLDTLRTAGCLTDTDVPLALILWTTRGLEFTDMWAVRRRIHSPYVFNKTPYPFTDRRTAELEATYYQFQEHIEGLLNHTPAGPDEVFSTANIRLEDYFVYLPSAGILPLKFTEQDVGFHFEKVFEGRPLQGRFTEGAKLRYLINLSFSFPPINLEEKELIRVYGFRQNAENFVTAGEDQEQEANTLQIYAVFAGGHIPFLGEAYYDVSRWDFSHYGPGETDRLDFNKEDYNYGETYVR